MECTAAKRTRPNDDVKLTDDEIRVVKIQFQQDTSFPLFDVLLREYYRFIKLKLPNPNAVLVPSFLINKLWHAHILSTREYEAFCERYNHGQLIHHYPSIKHRQKSYQKTLKAYKDMFGMEPDDPDIWPHHFNRKPTRKRLNALEKEAMARARASKQKASRAQEDQQSRRKRTRVDKPEDDKVSIQSQEHVEQESKAAEEALSRAKREGEEKETAEDYVDSDNDAAEALSRARQEGEEEVTEEDSYDSFDAAEAFSQAEREGGEEESEEGCTYYESDRYTAEKRENLKSNKPKGTTKEELAERHAEAIEHVAKEKTEEESEGGYTHYESGRYTAEQREYLENNKAKGTTEQELVEWHEEMIVHVANDEGFDPFECAQCHDGHFWVKGEFDVYCDGCREMSEGYKAFACV